MWSRVSLQQPSTSAPDVPTTLYTAPSECLTDVHKPIYIDDIFVNMKIQGEHRKCLANGIYCLEFF